MRGPFFGILLGLIAAIAAASAGVRAGSPPSDADVVAAFGKQGIRLSGSEARAIREDVRLALEEARAHGIGGSKVDFAAVEIASRLGLDISPGSNTWPKSTPASRAASRAGSSAESSEASRRPSPPRSPTRRRPASPAS